MEKHESKKESIPRTYFAIAVSDVHLGYKKADRDAFRTFIFDFLPKQSVNHFVMMGDVLDLWTRDDDDLLKEVSDILEQLSSLKKEGRIGHIDYVVGNHDYTIESHKVIFPVLSAFDFKSPQSEDPAWLMLEPPRQKGAKKKTFGFLHGHQLLEGRAGRTYDGTCRFLCSQGDLRGWLSRLLFDIRNWVPIIFAAASLLFLLQSRQYSALFAAILAVATGVTLYKSPPNLEAISATSYDEQIEALVRSMRWRDRRKIIRYLKQSPEKRRGMEPLQLRAIERAYNPVQSRLPDVKVHEAHTSLSKSLAAPVDESAYSALVSEHHRVLGHTHTKVQDPNYTNMGSWMKKAQHWYFTISESGEYHLEEWKQEPASKSRAHSKNGNDR